MFKGSFLAMAEAIATYSTAGVSAGATRPGTWQRVADNGAAAGRASQSMRARLTVIRPSFSLHQVQSLPPR